MLINKKMEDTISASELFSAFATSIEQLPFAYILKNYDGNVIEANVVARNLFGYTLEEFRELKKEQFLYFDESSFIIFTSNRNAFKEKSTKIRGIAKDKRKFSCLLSSYTISLNNKNLVCLIITDVAQEQKEKKLHRDIEILKETNRIAIIGSYEVDIITGNIILSNVVKEIHDIPVTDDFNPDFNKGILYYKEGESRDKMSHLLSEAINQGISFDTEVELVSAKGIEKWVRVTGNVEFSNGVCTRLYGVMQDIHQQKTYQLNLIQERSLLRTLIDALPVTVFIKDKEARKLVANKTDVKFMGLIDEKQAVGKTDLEIYNSELSIQSYERDLQILQTGNPIINTPESFIDDDGNEVQLLTSKYPIRNSKGEVDGIVGIANDVTVQQLIEQRLKLVDFCFKQSNISIFFVKHDASFYDFNDEAHNSLGYTRDEFVNLNVCDLNSNFIVSQWNEHWQELKEKKTIQITTTHTKKDGSTFDVEINASYVVHNGVELNCSFITDITDKKKIAYDLLRSNDRYEQAMIATSDAMWEVDFTKNELYLSANFKVLFGYDTIGLFNNDTNNWGKHVHPEDFPKVIAITESIIPTLKTTYTTEYRYQKANGEYVSIVDKVLVVRDAAGKALRLVGAMQDVTKKKIEEERLRLLETVATHSKDAILITGTKPIGNIDLPILYANQAYTDITGFTQEDLQNQSPRISQGPLSDKKELEKIRSAINNWKPCQIETINYRKNGEPYWVSISIVPVADESGWFTHWVSIQRDITAKKQAENAFREISSLQKNILDSAEFSIVSCDCNGLIMTFNPCAERLLGYQAVEMVGKHTTEIFHDKVEIISTARKLTLELGKQINPGFDVFVAKAKLGLVTESEWTYVRKNGERFPVSLSISALQNDLGEITGFLGIAKDITSEKAMCLELANSYGLLEETVHELEQQKFAIDQHSIVAITDTKGVIIYANDNFCKISKYSRTELIGKTHSIINSKVHDEAFFKIMHVTIANGMVWKGEICNMAKDGSIYWVDTTIVPYLDPKTNKPIRYIAIRSDITERKKVEIDKQHMLDELSHSNYELKQFSYITTHNLRAPLTNLMSICTLLKTDKIDDPLTLKLIDGFKTSTAHLNDTLNDLINILIIKEKRNLPVTSLNLNSMLNRVTESINATIVKTEAQIESNFELAPNVNFNNAYLESIFLNLITNSIKYAHPDRKPIIQINTGKGNNGTVILLFSDNGLGMNMERVKDKIFGLYQRFHTNDDSKGIGLYLIHSQITALGGKIEVESEVNVGTTYTITFK